MRSEERQRIVTVLTAHDRELISSRPDTNKQNQKSNDYTSDIGLSVSPSVVF